MFRLPIYSLILSITAALSAFLLTETASAQTIPDGGGVTVFRSMTTNSGYSRYGVPGLSFAPASRLFGNRNYDGRVSNYVGVVIRARIYSVYELDELMLNGTPSGAASAYPPASYGAPQKSQPQRHYSNLRKRYLRGR